MVELGGGRKVEGDQLNLAVGLSDVARLGTKLSKGQPMAVLHAARAADADRAEAAVRAAMTLGTSAPNVPELIAERIG